MKSILNTISYAIIIPLIVSCSSVDKGRNERIIYKSVAIHSNKGKVWSALTKESELSSWWNRGVKLEPNVGGKFYEPWGEGQLATGKVIALKPSEFIRFTWREKSWKSSEETICVFSLKESDGVTILEVKHLGWESFQGSKNRSQLIKGFKKGWDALLPKLKKHLEEQE